MDALPIARLRDAVARGIISEAQLDAILRLDHDDATWPGMGSPTAAGSSGSNAREAPRGLNWVSFAYYTGALLVLFAFGWFLVAWWETLRAPGVLAVSLAYAALFVAAARYLLRDGFRAVGALSWDRRPRRALAVHPRRTAQ